MVRSYVALTLGSLLILCSPLKANAQMDTLTGRWAGAIDIAGTNLDMVVEFAASGGELEASIDIQGATGVPLTNVTLDGNAVHFELQAGPGLAIFQGTIDGETITGSFTQAGIKGTFDLSREEADNSGASADPDTEQLPYAVEEVEFSNDTTKLAGTLTIPKGDGPHPAVVLVTGSGPQNRDEDIFGFKLFRVMADHLTRHGIAVLRYDDRGVGGSSGSVVTSTSEDFAHDVLAGIHFLQERPDIRGDRIGILGHSEGGIVAPIAATKSDDVAYIVLVAGPSVPGDEILLAQAEMALEVAGATPERLRKKRELQTAIFHAVRTDDGWDIAREHVEAELREALEDAPEESVAALGDVETYIRATTDATLAGIQNEWFRFFIDYDPADALREVRIPVLALFGEKDLQVPANLNVPVMERALREGGNRDFFVEVIPDANHLFQQAVSGSVTEYPTLPKEFAPGFLERITSWISERTM